MAEVDPMVLRAVRATRATISAVHYGDHEAVQAIAAELAGDSDALAWVLCGLGGVYLSLLAVVLGDDADLGGELERCFLQASLVESRLAGGEESAA